MSTVAFGAPVQKSPGWLLVSVLLSVAGLFPIGLMIAAMSKTAGAASVIGRLAFFPLIFFAGLWLPRALMPAVLLDISNYSPLGPAVQAMQSSMLTGFPPGAAAAGPGGVRGGVRVPGQALLPLGIAASGLLKWPGLRASARSRPLACAFMSGWPGG
jgi:hypothetical protein